MNHIGVQNAIWTRIPCRKTIFDISDIDTTSFCLQILLFCLSSFQRCPQLLAAPCRWRYTSGVVWLTNGNSTISNQLEAGSIMVRAMKSICELSLPLVVFGPMRSTHIHYQGLLMMDLGGKCPYLTVRLLFVWQVLQDLNIDGMVVCIPFQYIAAFIISSRRVCPGCYRYHGQWQVDRPWHFVYCGGTQPKREVGYREARSLWCPPP
jgi:hypothetical protein